MSLKVFEFFHTRAPFIKKKIKVTIIESTIFRKKVSVGKSVIYVLFLSSFLNLPVFCNDDEEITIFDVGQGNCVLVKHKNQATLIDAGSKELSFSALYDQLFGYGKQRYRIVEPEEVSDSDSVPDASHKGIFVKSNTTDDEDESDTSDTDIAEESDSEEEIDPTSDTVDTEQDPESTLCKNYRRQIIDSLVSKLPKIEEKISPKSSKYKEKIKLNAVVISHPDEDHYNLLTQIFSKDFAIDTIILGGFFNQYNPTLQGWLYEHHYNPGSKKSIGRVIFTGTNDGSNKPDNNEEAYGRAYCSLLKTLHPSITPKEALIENALNPAGGTPRFEILAMNAGHAQTPSGKVYIANDNKNTNSIVLRAQGTYKSFLIPGDADGCTWNFIKAYYKGNEGKLRTNCLLLSHHGALEDEATRSDMLNLFKPMACFISNGRHGKYHHPRKEVIEKVLSIGSLGRFVDEDKKPICHPISYYKQAGKIIVRKRKSYEQILLSTLDEGTMRFILSNPSSLSFSGQRDRVAACKMNSQDIVFTITSELSSNKKALSEIKKIKKMLIDNNNKSNIKTIFFTRHSNNYDLILPENGNALDVGQENTMYYLIDLKNGNISPITVASIEG